MNEVTFTSAGVRCAAWHLPATTDDLRRPAGSPCVVMAHGFGGTCDAALLRYAEGFAATGLDVLLFDYRGFGASAGMPRQVVSYRRQRADYRAAIAAARALDGVDPDGIVLWGTSYSAGHVIAVAADRRMAAVVALTPAADGAAALLAMLRQRGPAPLARLVGVGLRDVAGGVTGRPPVLVPIVGPAGSDAIMAHDAGAAIVPALAGPTWRNEVCARSSLGVGLNRPVRSASRLRCPLLVQIGEHDSVAPPEAGEALARRAGAAAEVRRYPVDHFDVYDGPWQEQVLGDQLKFLRRHLAHRMTTDHRKVSV